MLYSVVTNWHIIKINYINTLDWSSCPHGDHVLSLGKIVNKPISLSKKALTKNQIQIILLHYNVLHSQTIFRSLLFYMLYSNHITQQVGDYKNVNLPPFQYQANYFLLFHEWNVGHCNENTSNNGSFIITLLLHKMLLYKISTFCFFKIDIIFTRNTDTYLQAFSHVHERFPRVTFWWISFAHFFLTSKIRYSICSLLK